MSKAIYKNKYGVLYISEKEFEFYNDAAQYYGPAYVLVGMLNLERILHASK